MAESAEKGGDLLFLDLLLKMFFPENKVCLICGRSKHDSGPVCKKCEGQLKIETKQCCPVCDRYWVGEEAGMYADGSGADRNICSDCLNGNPPYFAARSLGSYGGLLKDSIYIFKYQGHFSMADFLGRLLAELFLKNHIFIDTDLIVPVPLSEEKIIDRGFNESELLARKMGSLLDLPAGFCLQKLRDTPSQSKLTRKARRDNVAGAYDVVPGFSQQVKGKQVLLIDDILTTGATAAECTRMLLKAGAVKVGVITLASALLEKSAQP